MRDVRKRKAKLWEGGDSMLRRAWLPKALRTTLLAVLVLAVAACGVGQQGPSQGGGGGGPNKICMMPKLVGIPYFNASEQGANEAAKELDVDLVYDGPTEATFQAIGYKLVDVMAKQTGGKGEFLVVTGSLTAPNQVAWLKEMRERMKEKYPEMSIASVEPGEEDLQLGIDITKNYLRAHPDTAGVFGITSVALPGAAEAVEQAGLEGKVAVTGLSTPNEMKPYLNSGAVEKFVLWNPEIGR